MPFPSHSCFSRILLSCCVVIFVLAGPANARAALRLGFEIGSAFPSIADIRVPGAGGTFFSFEDDFYAGMSPFFRLQAVWEITRQHAFFGIIAPLRLSAIGPAPKALDFDGAVFAEGAPLWLDYKLDTYRLGYLFTLIDVPAFMGKIGLSARFRNSAIKLNGSGGKAEYTADDLLPELCLSLNYFTGGGFTLIFEGEAMRIKKGYACELFIGGAFDLIGTRYSFRAGWRAMLDKTDSDKHYAQTWANQIVLGAGMRL